MDDPVQHSRKRRIIAQALTVEAVKSMELIILVHVDQLCVLLTPSTSQ
jgi:cytochrome P450